MSEIKEYSQELLRISNLRRYSGKQYYRRVVCRDALADHSIEIFDCFVCFTLYFGSFVL